MLPNRFEAPPFVAWLIKEHSGHATSRAKPQSEDISYRLVPHEVFRHILIHCLLQWVALFGVLLTAFSYDCVSYRVGFLIYILALPTFIFFALVFNVYVSSLLNSPSQSKIGALFNHCPREVREEFQMWLPSINNTERKWLCHATITWRLLLYFLSHWLRPINTIWRRTLQHLSPIDPADAARLNALTMRKEWRWLRPIIVIHLRFQQRLSRKNDPNAAKLEALTLRREDSWLQAFSAFAAVTSFVSERQRHPAIPSVHTQFLLSYFSPIGFGFGLCLMTFALYPAMSSAVPETALFAHSAEALPRFPFMICIAVWFAQGSFYVLFDLKQDFAAIFHNYFDTRIFPKSMTRFAESQMAAVPDLVAAMENHWIPWTIEFIMFGLAGLYAGFMHNLA